MFARAVLLIPGALFIVYGAMCWYNPELPAEYAGLWVAHQDGLAELAAMYGGLQLCLGSIIFLSGILKGYLRPGLWLLMMCLGGLAAARGSVAFGHPRNIRERDSRDGADETLREARKIRGRQTA